MFYIYVEDINVDYNPPEISADWCDSDFVNRESTGIGEVTA